MIPPEEVRQRHVQSQTSHMTSMYIEGFCIRTVAFPKAFQLIIVIN